MEMSLKAWSIRHDPEKWVPVFRKDHAQNREIERDDGSQKSHSALGAGLNQKHQILRIARPLLLILLVVLLLPYLLAPLYRAGHPVSTLMVWRRLTGAPVSRQWVDFGAISPYLPRSVVGSEDAKFCSHHGVDWDALQDVIDDAEEGEVTRGGSGITQQVAKNLFLWPGRSVVRKALELPLALWIDFVLSKQRILEIYLNIAELGPSGQFGAEAGAMYAFGHPASSLSLREAALLAAILPNPVKRSARNPGPGVRRLAGTYTARAQSSELQRCWRENRAF
jgi:monofunctional glycosyltransferase